MATKSDKPKDQNPADIAREAFKRLAMQRIAPTPDAYREVYDEIAGTSKSMNAESVLVALAEEVSNGPREIADLSTRFNRAVRERDWQAYSKYLSVLIEKYSVLSEAAASKPVPPPAPPAVPLTNADPQSDFLRDMLARTLTFAVASLLQDSPDLAKDAESLAESAKEAKTETALKDVAGRLKQLCFKIEMKSGDMAEQQEMLLRLFQLLLENVGELLEDDSWLRGQIEGVQSILSGPINHYALKDATRSLKEVIYKQGLLKHSLAEAKLTVKNMMITFIDQLSSVASTTGDYHEKMNAYSLKISQAPDIITLNKILDDVMRDTRAAQIEALRSRDEMLTAKQKVLEAEDRIHQLESQLEQMGDLVREDQLTGSLNRRGLEDVFEREMARSDRKKSPLCIGLLDLDDFKKLNDTYGHVAGDEALIHLVRVIKDTLRTMDVIARFGGEEFLIVLPDTPLESAVQTVSRIQRELTKRIFMQNDQRLFITFSAGVALRKEGEEQTAMIERADKALYTAKREGKNRVVAAE